MCNVQITGGKNRDKKMAKNLCVWAGRTHAASTEIVYYNFISSYIPRCNSRTHQLNTATVSLFVRKKVLNYFSFVMRSYVFTVISMKLLLSGMWRCVMREVPTFWTDSYLQF